MFPIVKISTNICSLSKVLQKYAGSHSSGKSEVFSACLTYEHNRQLLLLALNLILFYSVVHTRASCNVCLGPNIEKCYSIVLYYILKYTCN